MMKNIISTFKPVLWIFAAAALFPACTDDDSHISYGLVLSDHTHAFKAAGGEVTIEVNTSYPEGWDTQDKPVEWLTEKKRTGSSVTYEASANMGVTERSAEVTFTAGTLSRTLKLTQSYDRSGEKTGLHIFDDTDLYPISISSSGKYIVTIRKVTEGEVNMLDLYLFDTDTFESSLAIRTAEAISGIAAVTDNGIILASVREDGMPNDIIIKDGQVDRPLLPQGYNSPGFRAASADGTVIAGFCFKTGEGTIANPVRWTNGVPEVLEFPDINRGNGYRNYGGSQARAVTPDGKYVFGRAGNQFDGIYWEAGSTKWTYVGDMTRGTAIIDNWEGNEEQASVQNFVFIPGDTKIISPNGKYVAVSYWGPGIGPERERVQYAPYPALWDVEKGELVMHMYDFDLDQDGNQVPTSESGDVLCAGDDGRLFYIADPYFKRYYSMWHDGVISSPDNWLNEAFGSHIGRNVNIMMYRESPMLIMGTFMTDNAEPTFVISESMLNSES